MDNEIRQKILDFVHSRPRAVSEIAALISKNWRTADRYLEQLAKEDLIKLHVFRKGGRGALKIAFWPSSIRETPSAMKNFLLYRIINGRNKGDFSALDIVQNINQEKRKVSYLSKDYYHSQKNISEFWTSLKKAQNQILFFSGNLSFTDISGKYKEFIELMRSRVQQGINIFILTRVDISDLEKVKELLNTNKAGYSGTINIRYAHQPLRCTIIDEDICFLKEDVDFYSNTQDKAYQSSTFIYTITEHEWVEWLAKVFWHLWHSSIDAERRLIVLEEVSKK